MAADTAIALAPEILLVVVAVAIYVGSAFTPRLPWNSLALGALVLAAVVLAGLGPLQPAGFDPLTEDGLAWFGRWLALGTAIVLILLAWPTEVPEGRPEYLGSLLLLTSGVMLAASAADLVLLFVALELVSIPTYILLYLGRRDAASQEAAAKYFYLSLLASALFLYGLSFLYGVSGTTDLRVMAERLARPELAGVPGALGRVALVLVVAGLGFRITAVPFHFYAPDVYQGTTHANAALLSVAPKIAGMLVLVRLVAGTLAPAAPYAWPLVGVLAAATMTAGNVVALWQTHLRRLMAYSAIAHAGYLLVGLTVRLGAQTTEPWDGIAAVAMYLVVYALATLGVFSILAALCREGRPVETLDDLAGLARAGGWMRSFAAWSLAVFLFSLAGLPPLAGFWGKFALFAGAISLEQFAPPARPWLAALAVCGVLNSVISAVYYLRIVGVMFFRLPEEAEGPGQLRGQAAQVLSQALAPLAAALACLVLVVGIGVRPGAWLDTARRATLPVPVQALSWVK